jgi:hypothetical protein
MQGAAEQGQLLEIKKGDNPHRQKGWVMKPRQWKEASRGHDPSFMAMLFGVAEGTRIIWSYVLIASESILAQYQPLDGCMPPARSTLH